MQYCRLGATEFRVSRAGLGCMSMSGAYGPADDNESIATLHRAFDLGINVLDFSSSCGSGHNHALIEYSLWSRDPEGGNIQACREFNMGFMAYSRLGRVFLPARPQAGAREKCTASPSDPVRRIASARGSTAPRLERKLRRPLSAGHGKAATDAEHLTGDVR